MNATLKQDIIHIINEFKKHVNPEFVASPKDIEKIKELVTEHSGGRSNEDGGDVMYTYIDYDGLKRHKVKDFSFSAIDYEKWTVETLEILKAECRARRKQYGNNWKTIKAIQLFT